MVCDSGSAPSSLDDVERWLQCPFGQGSGLSGFRGAPTVLLVQAVSAGGGGSRLAMVAQFWGLKGPSGWSLYGGKVRRDSISNLELPPMISRLDLKGDRMGCL
jgi:hypothetical protein